MRILSLATALLCVATHAGAQAHEPAPKPGAKPPPAATAHAPTAAAGQDAHAAPARGSDQKSAEAAKKGPTVSRVSMSPKAAADDALAPFAATPGSHGSSTKAGGAQVATSGLPKGGEPAMAGEKSKPVVSGAERMTATPAPTGDVVTPGPHGAPSTVSRGVAAAPAAHSAPAAAPSAVVKTPAANGPVKLATVHGRLAAALAEFRPEPHGDERDRVPPGGGGPHAKGAEPVRRRIALIWPKARWRVEWADADRVMVVWPE